MTTQNVREYALLFSGEELDRILAGVKTQARYIGNRPFQPGDCVALVNAYRAVKITAVKRHRLQAITEADAEAEGVTLRQYPRLSATYGEAFAVHWDLIHGPGAWEENPLVTAITFELEPEDDADGDCRNVP